MRGLCIALPSKRWPPVWEPDICRVCGRTIIYSNVGLQIHEIKDTR